MDGCKIGPRESRSTARFPLILVKIKKKSNFKSIDGEFYADYENRIFIIIHNLESEIHFILNLGDYIRNLEI
jgi:hypothetical protein